MGLGSCVDEASELLHIESHNIAIDLISPRMVQELRMGKRKVRPQAKTNIRWQIALLFFRGCIFLDFWRGRCSFSGLFLLLFALLDTFL